MSDYQSIVARMLALHPRRIDLSLGRMERVLDALGHPECRVPPVIHVAGTNGKGSVIAFMRAVAEAAGLSVHVYTSPHLVRFNERFRIGRRGGGVLVSDAELAELMDEVERANGGEPITVFEVETAVAFLLYARHPADLLLLEVGLGGRLDATNVIARPLASIVTPVSMDHMDFLGDTIEKIAAEKAAIFRRGVPAVVAPQSEAALAVIERTAATVRAPLKIAGQHWSVHQERGRLVYQDDDGLLDLPAPRLAGAHQFDNAGTAIAALRACGVRLPQGAFEAGILNAEWPARLQRLSQGALTALIPPGSELWIDGGHNVEGGKAVAAALGDIEERVPRPLLMIVGMLSTKDCEGFLRNFSGLARRVIAVPIPDQDKSMSAAALAEIARSVGIPADGAATLRDALLAVPGLDLAPPPRILITGSLYFAGWALAQNGTPPQ